MDEPIELEQSSLAEDPALDSFLSPSYDPAQQDFESKINRMYRGVLRVGAQIDIAEVKYEDDEGVRMHQRLYLRTTRLLYVIEEAYANTRGMPEAEVDRTVKKLEKALTELFLKIEERRQRAEALKPRQGKRNVRTAPRYGCGTTHKVPVVTRLAWRYLDVLAEVDRYLDVLKKCVRNDRMSDADRRKERRALGKILFEFETKAKAERLRLMNLGQKRRVADKEAGLPENKALVQILQKEEESLSEPEMTADDFVDA